MNHPRKKAIVLLSGGLDSATVLAVARNQGYDCHALSFQYGQRHEVELRSARKVAQAFQVVEHQVFNLDFSSIGGSALTSPAIEVPQNRTTEEMSEGIPVTYVPARNTVFLAIALALAEAREAFEIFIGVNALDYSGYPDCRPEFIQAFENLANLATKAGVEGSGRFRIQAPLIHLSKAQIIRLGTSLGVDFSMTHSCYAPSPMGEACGCCDSCELRRKGFAEASIPDPTIYRPC